MRETIFEKSQKDQHAYNLPKDDSCFQKFLFPKELQRTSILPLPEISELDLVRHYSLLASENVGIDTTFYPLGSCTMKYNPRVNEHCASMPAFADSHPLADDLFVQGNLEITYDLIQQLCNISGMAAGTLVPNAGAQGEFTGISMIAAYHRFQNNPQRNEILIPDNAHGTNPATASMAGFKTITIPSDSSGDIDLEILKKHLSSKTAALMLTNPNTLGLFSTKIVEIADLVHESGGLLYYDGANLNALLEIVRPGDMGFDVMHINLHKTFSTPHGGGGPGSGPVLCQEKLKPFLPIPQIEKINGFYRIAHENPYSIGRIASFYGNFGIYLRAYVYIKMHGKYGLRKISEMAVLNANYLKKKLSNLFTVPYPQYCMHEFVLQADRFLKEGVHALDIAKRLLDYGIYAPTIYFPLIVKECMLIEPTETESLRTLDRFIEIMEKIVQEIGENPSMVKNAPHRTPVRRLDEVLAAKKPVLTAMQAAKNKGE